MAGIAWRGRARGAGLAGLLTFFVTGGSSVGWMWALVVFLGVLMAWVVVAVTRANNQSQVEQP